MRAVTVSPFAHLPAPTRSCNVADKALSFRERWTKPHAIPFELEVDDRGHCLLMYADFLVKFKPDGFNVYKRSEYATDEILTAVIELAADIHNTTHKTTTKAEGNR